MEKITTRKAIRKILQQIQPEEISKKSARIAENVFQTVWWNKAEIILAFCSMEKEVDTRKMIKMAFSEAKMVGVPRIQGDELVFHRIQQLEDEFVVSEFGIREPDRSWSVLDFSKMGSQKIFIMTPGLAFDRKKNRLGRGRGFYDRFLQQMKIGYGLDVFAGGVGFSEQLLAQVPVRDHDQPVDAVITEKEIVC